MQLTQYKWSEPSSHVMTYCSTIVRVSPEKDCSRLDTVFHVATLPPIAWLYLLYINHTQPIIPRFTLTKGLSSKHQLLESLYGGQFQIINTFDKTKFLSTT